MIKDVQNYNNTFYEATSQTDIAQRENEYLTRIYRKLAFEKKKCCDFGCGTGYWTKILSEIGADIIGTDISADLIAFCQENDPRGIYLTVREALICKYDYIFANWVFQELTDKSELERVMRQLRTMSKVGTEIYLVENIYPDIKKAKLLFRDDFGEVFQYPNGDEMRFFPNGVLTVLFSLYDFIKIRCEEFGDSFLTCFKLKND